MFEGVDRHLVVVDGPCSVSRVELLVAVSERVTVDTGSQRFVLGRLDALVDVGGADLHITGGSAAVARWIKT